MTTERTVTRRAKDGTRVMAYTARMRDGIEERTYPSGKRTFFVRVRFEGRQRSMAVQGPQTWRSARTYKAAIVTQLARGEFLAPEKLATSFDAFAAEWSKASSVKSETTAIYDGYLRLHLLPALGGAEMAQVTPQAVEQFQGRVCWLRDCHHARRG